MRRAAQRVGVAITLQEIAPRRCGLLAVDVKFRGELRITSLQRRVHQVAGDYCAIPAAPKGERNVSRRMARRRQNAGMIADLEIVVHDLGSFGFDDRQHAVAKRRNRRFGVLVGPVIEFILGK